MSADMDLRYLLSLMETQNFSGTDIQSYRPYVETEYMPGKLKVTLTQDYGDEPSVLELLLDEHYYVTGVVQIMDGVPINWSQDKVNNSQLRLLDYLLTDPRYILHYRDNATCSDTGHYHMNVTGPAMTYLKQRGIEITVDLTIGNHGPVDMVIWKLDESGDIEIIKDLYFYN